jgi:hypothetical protein
MIFDTYAGAFGVFPTLGELILKAKQSKAKYPALSFDILDWKDETVIIWVRHGGNVYIGTDARIGMMGGFLWSMSGYPGVKIDPAA